MRQEPKLEKNYVIALVLSMLILMVYPYVLKKFFPAAETPQAMENQDTRQRVSSGRDTAEATAERSPAALKPAEGPFLEEKTPPAVIRYENELYEVEFSTLGATITRLVYKDDTQHGPVAKSVFFEGDISKPGLFGVRLANERGDLTRSVFKMRRQGRNKEVFEFTYEKPGQYRMIKTFILGSRDPLISMDVTMENLAASQRQFPLEVTVGMEGNIEDGRQAHEFEAVAWTDKVVSADHGKVSKKGFEVVERIKWAGILKHYFALLIKPQNPAIAYESRTEGNEIWSRLRLEPMAVRANESAAQEIFVFAGPQRYETLKRFEAGFENILSRGFFGLFKIWLLRALKFSHQFTNNFGWDIILLTFIIKLLFAPLTHVSYRSMEKMKALQPKVKALQDKFKKDPQRMNKEMMELYKKHRVNPMGGCLPMLLQIPIFIAFYQVLNETIELKGAPFMWWITNLSEPDALFMFPFSLPLLGDSFNLLPILMLASMFVQQKLTPQAGGSPEQQKIFMFMPLIFGFIFYKMPSGLVLYWFINNLLSIFQQGVVKRMMPAAAPHEDD